MVSERCKLPIKVALALTLAIICALWLGWEKPYWAGLTVTVMAATETTGHSLQKGRQRIIGTVIGVFCAFLFVAFFSQQPIGFLLSFTAFNGFCVYMQGNPRSGYTWTMSLMVCVIVIAMGNLSGDLTFGIGILRLQETILGIICFTLVFSLLWPVSSRHLLQKTLLDFFVDQQSKADKTADALTGKGERSQGLGFGDGIKFLSRVEEILPAAILDSYHVSYKEQTLKYFLSQMHEWALLCGHLSEANELLIETASIEVHSEIKELLLRVKQRFSNAEKLTREKIFANNPTPKKIVLCVKEIEDPQQHGAILLLESVLNDLDKLNYKMLETLHDVLSEDAPKIELPTQNSPNKWVLDHNRLSIAIKSCVASWIFIALWLYVPMTGGIMIAMLGVILGAVVFSLPFCNVKTLLYYMVSWSAFILLQYLFILPHLCEIWQLAGFYFINCFGIWYKLPKPQQVLIRLLGTQLLIVMTMNVLKIHPEYSIEFPLLELFLIIVAMLVIYFINLGLFPNRPERIFLRQLILVEKQFSWQLRSLSLSKETKSKAYCSIGKYIWGQSPLHSVMIAELAMRRINWPGYPQVDQKLTGKIVDRLYSANLCLLSFQDSYIGCMEETKNQYIRDLLEKSTRSLSNILNKIDNVEQLEPLELKFSQIQCHLQEYLNTVNTNSILQYSLTEQEALSIYRTLAGLKLLIVELKKLSVLLSKANLKELKYSYFSL